MKIFLNKTILSIFTLIMGLNTFAGEKTVKVNDFTSVTATGNYKVTLIKSSESKVEIINNDEKVTDEQILAEVEGAELVLKIKNDTYKQRDIEFRVYYKEVFELDAKRGAMITTTDVFEHEKIDLSVNSGGRIVINIKATTVDVTIKNGGTIRVSGTTENANYFISKGGNVAAFNLIASKVKSEVLFGGEILLNVTKSLFAVVKSGGTIKYKGKPSEVDESIKLGGKIVKLDK